MPTKKETKKKTNSKCKDACKCSKCQTAQKKKKAKRVTKPRTKRGAKQAPPVYTSQSVPYPSYRRQDTPIPVEQPVAPVAAAPAIGRRLNEDNVQQVPVINATKNVATKPMKAEKAKKPPIKITPGQIIQRGKIIRKFQQAVASKPVKMDIGQGTFQPVNAPQSQSAVQSRDEEPVVMMDTTDKQVVRARPSSTNYIPRYILSSGQPTQPLPQSIPASVFNNPTVPVKKSKATVPQSIFVPASVYANPAKPPVVINSGSQATGLKKDGSFDLRTKKGRELFQQATTKAPVDGNNTTPPPEMAMTVVTASKPRKIKYQVVSENEAKTPETSPPIKKGKKEVIIKQEKIEKRKEPEENMSLVLYEPPESSSSNNVVVQYKTPNNRSHEGEYVQNAEVDKRLRLKKKDE